VGEVLKFSGTPWHCGGSEEWDASTLARLGPDLGTALGNCSTICLLGKTFYFTPDSLLPSTQESGLFKVKLTYSAGYQKSCALFT